MARFMSTRLRGCGRFRGPVRAPLSRGGPARHLTWATIRRLAHMREGVHDLVKSELQGTGRDVRDRRRSGSGPGPGVLQERDRAPAWFTASA